MQTRVKICGLTTPQTYSAAIDAGADFTGLVFYSASPRFANPGVAAELGALPRRASKLVGLFVNADDETIGRAVETARLDMIQLHGDETPARVWEIKSRFERPVIRAVRVANARDVENARAFEDAADWLLFDYYEDGGAYGGTGKKFDWSMLSGQKFKTPWMLSGGLNANNISDALQALSPDAVDVSSGVEIARGVKDIQKIGDFINKVRGGTHHEKHS